MIYVSTFSSLNFAFFPTTSADNEFTLTLFAINPSDWSRSNGFLLGESLPIKEIFTNDRIKKSTVEYVDPGFYLAKVAYTPSRDKTSRINLQMTFQTDPYKCPYNPQFSDQHQNFQGCTPKALPMKPTQDEGLPCLAFNKLTK